MNCEYDLNFLLLYLDSFSKISHFSRTHQVQRRNPIEPKRKRRRKSTRKVLQIPAHLQNLLMKRYFQIPKFWFDFLCYLTSIFDDIIMEKYVGVTHHSILIQSKIILKLIFFLSYQIHQKKHTIGQVYNVLTMLTICINKKDD